MNSGVPSKPDILSFFSESFSGDQNMVLSFIWEDKNKDGFSSRLVKIRESKTHNWIDKGPHDTACLEGLMTAIKGNCPFIQLSTPPANLYQKFWTKSRNSALYSQCHHKVLGIFATYHTRHLLLELKKG